MIFNHPLDALTQNNVVVIPLIGDGPPTPVPKTGAGTIDGYTLADGEDGDLQKGKELPWVFN